LRHARRAGGVCRWCGDAILHETGPRAGAPNGRRAWHPACVETYKLHAWPETQFEFVRKRDGRRCAECGARPKKWAPARRISVDRETRGRFVRVKRVCALELDHAVPLWSVAALPDDERRGFFGPGNLRLLCPACHRAKTTREAAERADRRRAGASEAVV
jgi:5-methylcytosine-specific restriction endonuclease McrA